MHLWSEEGKISFHYPKLGWFWQTITSVISWDSSSAPPRRREQANDEVLHSPIRPSARSREWYSEITPRNIALQLLTGSSFTYSS